MTAEVRKFGRIGIYGTMAIAMLAVISPALAQTDLNRFVPKFPSASPNDESFEEEGDYDSVPNRPRYAQRPKGERKSQPTPESYDDRDERPASYQRSPVRSKNSRSASPDRGAKRYSSADERRSVGRDEFEEGYEQEESSPRAYSGRTAYRSGNGMNRNASRGRSMYEESPANRRAMSRYDDGPRNDQEEFSGEDFDGRPQYPHAAYQNMQYPNNSYPNTPASYQPSSRNYQSGNRGMPGYGQMNGNGGMSGRAGFNGMGFGGMNFGGMFGPLASRNMTGTPTPATPVVTGEPIVTPDAVYIDAEPVKAGKPVGPTMSMPAMPGSMSPGSMPSGGMPNFQGPMTIDGEPMTEGGRSYLPGGPIMGRSYDGYTNPQCNDCCGGGCGGNCGGGCCGGGCGPQCGNNCGMYGGCEEGYDCCGGCGPNYGPFNGPYGRPWIFAPLDFVFGGLWHCGPWFGACDPCGNWWWGQDLTVFGGAHDFRSPVNITGNSNFGAHEGLNWSMPLWHEYGIGAQVGFQATQNNFQENQIDVFDVYRKQTFVTAGLFHRPCDGHGLQYGAVFDYLNDEFYQQFNVGQVRGEISWLFDCRNELGFWFAAGVMDSNNEDDDVFFGATEYYAIDQFAFYYRRRFCRGGEGRLWGGFTENSGGLIGADFRLPISKHWAVETGFNYIINQNEENQIFRDETWNVGMNLVWYVGGNANCRSLYRPLFNVADNGTFMVNRRGLIGP